MSTGGHTDVHHGEIREYQTDMSIEFSLPNIGEGVESADIAEILVSVGDVITADQPVMELETEKAVVELPCPHAGRIEELLVAPGDTVQVGQPILKIDESQSGTSAAASSQESKSAQEEAASEPPAKSQEAVATEEAAPSGASGESFEFKLPNLGEGVETADIAEVLVKEGDTVEAEQPVMELETEKAVVELPCPQAGTISKIHVGEGDTVSVGQLIMTLAGSGAGAASQPAPPSQQKPSSPAREAELVSAEESRPTSPAQNGEAAQGTGSSADNGQDVPVPAAPSTRRLARQLGVDLRQVSGTGRGGRITQDDVQAFVKQQLRGGQALSRPVSHDGAGGGLMGGSLAPPPLPDFSRFGPVDREKMNKLSRTAAENLTASWNVIPHVTQHDRADITDLEAARKRFGQSVGKDGPRVTMTAIVMKALTKCLQGFPKFNSSLDPETNEIVYKRYFHIGCAVDTPNGLVVPVIRDCDSKSILDIAQELGELAAKARDRKLSIESMQGATCTVTNLGGIGGVGFTPIVNYPEVCILGMSRGQQELQMIDGEVKQRLMLPLSLSYDHRVINGADAARFLVTLTKLLADPFQGSTIPRVLAIASVTLSFLLHVAATAHSQETDGDLDSSPSLSDPRLLIERVEELPEEVTNSGEWQSFSAPELAERLAEIDERTEANRSTIAFLESATYRALVSNTELLNGECEFQVARRGNAPTFLDWSESNIALHDMRWEEGRAAWGAAPDGRQLLLVDRPSGLLTAGWSRRGESILDRVTFDIRLPSSMRSTLILQVRDRYTLESSAGLVRPPEPAPQPGWNLWTIDLGRRSECRIRIGVQASDRTHPLLACETATVYSVRRDGLHLQADYAIEVHDAPLPEITFEVPRGVENVRATLNGVPVSTTRETIQGAQLFHVKIHDLPLGQRGSIRIRGFSPIRWSTGMPTLPRIHLRDGIVLGETLSLIVEHPLEVQDIRASGWRQMSLSADDAREIWSFRATDFDPTIAVS
ncbi:Dihydrolipoyllysine-residue acetyltransferase component of pyruvate dehydrogenase complex (Dihydrolipoamide acetyltransferase component of pyruvate dehydrogenase complex) (E2), partial [Durusdinium trenchii]